LARNFGRFSAKHLKLSKLAGADLATLDKAFNQSTGRTGRQCLSWYSRNHKQPAALAMAAEQAALTLASSRTSDTSCRSSFD